MRGCYIEVRQLKTRVRKQKPVLVCGVWAHDNGNDDDGLTQDSSFRMKSSSVVFIFRRTLAKRLNEPLNR